MMQIQRVQGSDRLLIAATAWLLISLAALAEADETGLREPRGNGVGSEYGEWNASSGAADNSGGNVHLAENSADRRWSSQYGVLGREAHPVAWQAAPSMVAPPVPQAVCSVCLSPSPMPPTHPPGQQMLQSSPLLPPPPPPLRPFTIRLTFVEPLGSQRPLDKDAGRLRDNGVRANQCPRCPPGFARAAVDDRHATTGRRGNEGSGSRRNSESSSATDLDDLFTHSDHDVSSQQYRLQGPDDDDNAQSDGFNSSTTTTVSSPRGSGRGLVDGESPEYDRLYRQREMDEIGGNNTSHSQLVNDAQLWPTIVRPPSSLLDGRRPPSASVKAAEEWRNQSARHGDGAGGAGDRVVHVNASSSTRFTNGLLPSAQPLDGNNQSRGERPPFLSPLHLPRPAATASEAVVDTELVDAQQWTRAGQPPPQKQWRGHDAGAERYNGWRQLAEQRGNGRGYHYVYYDQPKAIAPVVRGPGPSVYYFRPGVVQYSAPWQQAFVYRQPFVPGFLQQNGRSPSSAVVRPPAESTDERQWQVGAPAAEPESIDRLGDKAQIVGREEQRWRIPIPPYLYYYGQQPPFNAPSEPISTNATWTANPTQRFDEYTPRADKKSVNIHHGDEEGRTTGRGR